MLPMQQSPCPRRRRRARVSLVAAMAAAAGWTPAPAAPATGVPAIISFDIAAQPLSSALDAFSAATGLQLIYDGALAQGRRSNQVVGAMSPDHALRELLGGTGLVPVRGADAFTVLPADAADPRKQSLASLMPYLGVVQASLASAFCRWPQTRPGGYEAKLEFWIGPSGEIQRPHLLGSTADPARDQSIIRLLADLAVQRPPPDLPQPIIVAISSQSSGQTGDCPPEGSTVRAGQDAR